MEGDSVPEEASPVSISDDPDVAWDLMASGFLVLTGQWASVFEGTGVKEREAIRVVYGGRQGGWEVAKACPSQDGLAILCPQEGWTSVGELC